MHIIVADDDLSQRIHLSAMLRRNGHDVELAEDGEEAIEALKRNGAPVLICDVQMPGIDGMELATRVRGLDLGRYVYILMVTGLDQNADRMRGLEAGADDFMSKPVDQAVLLARLRSAERLIRYERDLHSKNLRLAQANEHIQADLDAAAAAQRALLPDPEVLLSNCRFSSSFTPSSSISGDVFGYFDLGPGKSGFFAADVSGHGVRAALSAVALGYMVSTEFFQNMVRGTGTDELRPERVAQVLDRRFQRDLGDDSYFTLFVGAIDEAEERLVFCQAGYPSPLLLRPGDEARIVGTGGVPVAMLPHAEFERSSVAFRRGDRLIVASDGVTEAASQGGELYGLERFSEFVTHRQGFAARAVLPQIANALLDWTGQPNLADDVSIIIIDKEG
ncbi:MAG: response regulator [Devosia sp.]|uniref:SpoIIE family protein phosphatase n=1 Tax=Devosia sp. TaxID=1871048 RepID=UPI00262B14F0|nr:SpoIIE family protein phosphatase [Devosia sp.]MDB5540999.1 response regulator [Devosia sp.]